MSYLLKMLNKMAMQFDKAKTSASLFLKPYYQDWEPHTPLSLTKDFSASLHVI